MAGRKDDFFMRHDDSKHASQKGSRPIKVLLTFFTLAVLCLTACQPWRALIVLDNVSECDGIKYRLDNTESGAVIEGRVPAGEKVEVEVTANVYYDYILDFTAAPRTPDDFRCTKLDQGKVLIPLNSKPLIFRLESQRQPTAQPTP